MHPHSMFPLFPENWKSILQYVYLNRLKKKLHHMGKKLLVNLLG